MERRNFYYRSDSGKAGGAAGEDRGQMGGTRVEEQELTAELAAVHKLIKLCSKDEIKKEAKGGSGGKGRKVR